MDIKGFIRNISPFGPSGKVDAGTLKSSTDQKSNANNDREGSGQSAGDQHRGRRSLSTEEIQRVVSHLESLLGIKENGLTVRVVNDNDITIVYIEDRDGKVVRRIPEAELSLMLGPEKKSGNLLNKAM